MSNRQTADPAAEAAQPARGARKPAPVEAPAPPETTAPAAPPAEEADASVELRPETGKRRMPDNLRRYLLRLQGGKMYLPAAYRIVWFRDEFPDWGVETVLLEGGQEAGFATVQAKVYNAEGRLIASGMKTETRQDFPAGWTEKAETGAIARALAVAGFGTQFTPELDDDGYRPADSPQSLPGAAAAPSGPAHRPMESAAREERNGRAVAGDGSLVWQGPGQCPNCHAPEGKRHGKPCVA